MTYKEHIPVLLHQSISGLNINPDGIYVDLTFGGGGHSKVILQKLSTKGKLFAFDQDQDSEIEAQKIQHKNFTFIRANFRFAYQFLKYHYIKTVDGVLADLGISSHQLDTDQRGFSFNSNSKLDMRMDNNIQKDAKHILNTYSLNTLTDIFKNWGEIRKAYFLAKTIVEQRQLKTIQNTEHFIKIIQKFAPHNKKNKFYAKIFQALRIAVNDELKALQEMLQTMPYLIKPGGRLVILAYHSLEDRIVKKFLHTGNCEGIMQKDYLGNIIHTFLADPKKAIKATTRDIIYNNRARSVRLRIGKKM